MFGVLRNFQKKVWTCLGIFCYRTITATERRRGAPPNLQIRFFSILQILNFPKFGNIFKLWQIIWKFSRGVRTSRARRGGRRRANSHHFCKNADFDDERSCVTHDGQTRFQDCFGGVVLDDNRKCLKKTRTLCRKRVLGMLKITIRSGHVRKGPSSFLGTTLGLHAVGANSWAPTGQWFVR